MNLRKFYFVASIIVVLLSNACSTKKDTFVNRNWHALNTKYNVLYNGNNAFDIGREELNVSYVDNYWELLPIERLEVKDEIKLDSEDNNPNFEIAEEKATKAIQKHSMDIQDEERNPQTDESFLLLGKARYFDQRYIPALEAFNYILKKYSQSDKLNEATIWREKTHIRLSNEELAIKNLKRLFKYELLKDQEYADAHAIMAQAYINLNFPDSALQELKVASAYTPKNEEKGRYYFIIGQLFNELGYKDSANYAFDKIIELNRKSPRVYMINAHIKIIQNTEITEANELELLEYLTELEENRENRPFLDKIYHEIANYYLELNRDSMAIVYYNKSLRATTNSEPLNALNYEYLAEYYFDNNEYKLSGNYFDSVLPNLPQNTKKYRAVKKKLDNLEDVIKYEDIVQHTDSILGIYYLPQDEQYAYFEMYIEKLKLAAQEEAERKEKQANAGFAKFAESQGGKANKGKFYFYNITSLGYGKSEFKRNWGERSLEDDWRWSNRNTARLLEGNRDVTENQDQDLEQNITEDQKYSVEYYLSQIPTEITVIDSLKQERNFANYQLGLIYKEKFKENLLAAEKLERVLKYDPEERLVLPTKYNLYKIYEETGSPLAADMKDNILTNHPDSRYAEILLNPNAILNRATDSPDAKYARLYKLYQQQQYLQVITESEKNINLYTGDPIVPKFEMLKANAIGRLQGYVAFKEALNYVALNYPNNPEGKKAQEIVKEQLPKLEPKEFSLEVGSEGTENWKVVYPFRRQQDDQAVALKRIIEKSISELNYKNKVSKDIYDLETEFVVVHGFISREYALGYVELLNINKDYEVDNENFVILSSNYKIIQVHKNLQEYINQVVTPKP
ncbi:tetratricopeptide repeat protein [Eudoraea chungangensis]|uniref:type IX secretion system periplasmic lipoprotein PorW/SprE n=1 Tax=Eudoraea chungangensis TaxID=1481905 RepID=UPI0023ED285B|nr:hypothetical protein [Eudoraea chungangensis]